MLGRWLTANLRQQPYSGRKNQAYGSAVALRCGLAGEKNMELIAGAALIALICAWWIFQAQARHQAKNTATQGPAADYPIPPALRADLPPENTSYSDPGGTPELKRISSYAEIVDPSGGVREISAEEVSALFRPIQTKLASLRKTAVNSTRAGGRPLLSKAIGAHTVKPLLLLGRPSD